MKSATTLAALAAGSGITFNVLNSTNGNLGNQSILVYSTPIDFSDNWVYAAWQNLTPGDGDTANFTLVQNVSGQMMSPDGTYTTASYVIDPGNVSCLTGTAVGSSPVLNAPVDGSSVGEPTVTPSQSGLKNNSADPGEAMYAQWFLDGNLAVQSNYVVPANGALSAFELSTTLYFFVGEYVQGANYTYQQVSPYTSYVVPDDASEVNVTVTWTGTEFYFSFDPSSSSM